VKFRWEVDVFEQYVTEDRMELKYNMKFLALLSTYDWIVSSRAQNEILELSLERKMIVNLTNFSDNGAF
jgi:hypothetical protein